ncbi:branched-chain amino acid ABC transporter permease [Streptomyces sp. NL15-2K]|uniref:branched-chain amino acid ABC transporter permease n=1 Tax=Streptomyces sp. NL15-2K TaxID=376149 RepID=UPI000F57EDD9|nr:MULTISPECIES: branched-chain amino acid ABC transporter permease [Actinomycetes]WKX10331.1 branched-chain amino acid ABC transporter permease [Kutzneria buriramensis]GCB48170.1 branched-chain amino acid transport system permease protein livM [Streptomyces sp. NL15-2K]
MDFSVIVSDALRSGLGPIAAIYALAAMGLNLHFGYTGLLNFGQVGFMLVGGYGLAVTVATYDGNMWLGVLAGIGCAIVLALLLGIPTLRLRADYLAITTIAAGETLRLFYRSSWAEPVTGGVFGLQRFAGDFYDLNPIPPGTYGVWLVEFNSRDLWVLIVGWGLVAVVGTLLALLVHSPWGRVVRSIREDETAARGLGKNVYAYKMQSLALGGVIGALAGMVQAIQVQSVNPDSFDPAVTFFLYTLLVLGGAGRILGPVVGSVLFWFVLTFLDSALRQAIDAGYISPELISTSEVGAVRFALVGLALILLIVFRPQGILGSRKEMLLGER